MPLVRLLPRIEPEDKALVVGSGAESATYLLAAHDAAVTFLAGDLGAVERVESRMAAEALASIFDAFVAPIGGGLPVCLDFVDRLDIVVIDPGTLADLCPVRAIGAPGRPAAAQPTRRCARHPRRLCPRSRLTRSVPCTKGGREEESLAGAAAAVAPRAGALQARVSAGRTALIPSPRHLTRENCACLR